MKKIKAFEALSDKALVEKAQGGDRTAFDILCDRHLDSVYNRVRAKIPPEGVEDVTQNVFVAAVRSLDSYRGDSSFRTWLLSIARYKIADYYRHRDRRPDTVPLKYQDSNPGRSDIWEDRILVRVALRQLPDHYQEILLLRFAEGLKFKQIAKALDISLDAAKSRYRRAVAKMADVIENEREAIGEGSRSS